MEKTLLGFQKEIETLRKSAADLQATLDSSKVDLQVMGERLTTFPFRRRNRLTNCPF